MIHICIWVNWSSKLGLPSLILISCSNVYPLVTDIVVLKPQFLQVEFMGDVFVIKLFPIIRNYLWAWGIYYSTFFSLLLCCMALNSHRVASHSRMITLIPESKSNALLYQFITIPRCSFWDAIINLRSIPWPVIYLRTECWILAGKHSDKVLIKSSNFTPY